MGKLKHFFMMRSLRKAWRKQNPHNTTEPVSYFPISHVKVGRYSYGGLNVLDFGSSYKLEIGSFCSIAPNVMFMLCADHYIDTVSTFPFRVKCLGESIEGYSKGDIHVADDVWIGYGAVIMSGVTIGQGAVVAAYSVVTKDVPPYAVVAGIPAKVIKYRFDADMIDALLEVSYDQLSEEMIKEHIDSLYHAPTPESIAWMPRKSGK